MCRPGSVDDILVSALLDLIPLLLWQRLRLHLSDATPGRSEVLEHALTVGAQHPLQTAGHRVRPEEVVVQSRVRVNPLAGVESEELVYQVTGVGVLRNNKYINRQYEIILSLQTDLHIGLQSLLDSPLDAPRYLQLVVEVQRLDGGPDIG